MIFSKPGPIIQSLLSELNLWYLDDGTLAGPLQTVTADVELIKEIFAQVFCLIISAATNFCFDNKTAFCYLGR